MGWDDRDDGMTRDDGMMREWRDDRDDRDDAGSPGTARDDWDRRIPHIITLTYMMYHTYPPTSHTWYHVRRAEEIALRASVVVARFSLVPGDFPTPHIP